MNHHQPHQNQLQPQSGHTFSAKEKDDETGYSYFGARYYDSELSVWLSVDPMSDAFPTISSYAYCYNNPINYTDAWGLYGDEASAQKAQQKATAKYGEARVGDVYYNSKKNEYAFQIYGKGKDKYNHTNSKGVNFAWRPDASVYNDKQYNNYANPSSNIKYSASANRNTVSQYTEHVLMDLLAKSGNSSALITSTTRTPQDQARIMYSNINLQGVAKQKALYGPSGDKVIDEYPDKNAMLQMILSVGPSSVSNHCGDPLILNVIDIAPSSIKYGPAFIKAVINDPRITKFFYPRKDPAYHLEIKQPK